MEGSSWALMRATRKAILTDAHNFWANDARKVWGKSRMRATYIPDARNPFSSGPSLAEEPLSPPPD